MDISLPLRARVIIKIDSVSLGSFEMPALSKLKIIKSVGRKNTCVSNLFMELTDLDWDKKKGTFCSGHSVYTHARLIPISKVWVCPKLILSLSRIRTISYSDLEYEKVKVKTL